MARSGIAPLTRTPLSLLLGFLLAVAALALGPGATTPASAAAGDLVCGNGYIYGVASGSANLYRVNSATGASSSIGSFGSGTTNINALGVDAAGDYAYAMASASNGTATMYAYRDATGTASGSSTVSGFNRGLTTFLAGAVDPSTGHYWVGGIVNNVFYAYSIDPATGALDSPAPRFTSTAGNFNADMAFDNKGNLYVAFSPSGSAGFLREYKAGELTGTPTGTQISTIPGATGGYPGVAFASDGYLYMTTAGTLRKVSPTDGSQVGGTIPVSPGSTFSDLGSCATPTVLDAVRKNVVSRTSGTDQFTLSLTGNSANATATTTGSSTGVQSATAGPVLIIPTASYTVAETAAGSTDLSTYLSSYRCVDANTSSVIASGSGTSLTLTPPATGSDGKGADITCTFTNEAKAAAISLTKHASGTPAKAGDQITYSFTVTNTGNRPLIGIAVTDPMLSGATITCASTSLAVGASTTCAASPAYTVTQADVEAGKVANSASVAATPPTGEGAAGSVSATDSKTVTIDRTAQLKIVKSASGSPYAAGDQITYGFTVTNTGNVQLTSVGIDDPLLSGVTCAATTLAPGASTTCSAPAYTVTAADVSTGAVTNTASPTGSSVVGTPGIDPASTPTVTTNLGTLPVASPDTRTTAQHVSVTLDPLANDAAGSTGGGTSGTLDPASVVFTSAAATDGGRTLAVTGEGTYSIDAATGAVTFDPEPGFTGAATPVDYSVTDSLGHTAASTVTITVTAVTPNAVDDTDTTPYLTPVTVAVLGNDAAGATSAPLDPSSVVFTSAAATDDGRALAVAGEGTYTIDPASGQVTFTPATGFTGTATGVDYRVADINGTTAGATLTITVTAPAAPSAGPDLATTLQHQAVTIEPATNDSAHGAATLDPTSVVFTSAAATDGGRTLVVAGEGTYTIDATTGAVTFDPEPSFSGTATPVDYRIADDLGQTATSTITVTVTPVHPTAADDSATTPYLTPVSLSPLANDSAGDSSAPLDATTVVFTDPAASDAGKTLVTTGGTWTIAADGTVWFTPADGFSGPTAAVPYEVSDSNGTTATADLVVTVGTAPVATDDTATTLQNAPVHIDALANDAAGSTGTPGTLVPTSVRFTSPDAVAGGRTLVVPGEGTYSIDALTGQVTFTPEASFSGAATPVTYEVADSFGNPATATITITVTAVVPNAAADTNHTLYLTAVNTVVVGNDTAGDPSAPLLTGSVLFTSPDATDGGLTLAVAGEGTYHANGDGSVTFTPEAGFSGAATPAGYRVSDSNGTTATATLTVTVGAPPAANPDVDATPQGTSVTVGLLGNDTPGDDGAGASGTFDPASVVFTDPAATDFGRTLVVAGQGTYAIDAATGAVTFDPEPTFTGTATPVPYRVTDSFAHSAASTLTISVTPVIPAATDDTNHTPATTPVTTDVLANDSEGAASAPLDPTSVVVTSAGATDGGRTLVVAGQGTWTVDPATGEITFAPEAGFSGAATISYQVADSLGTPASATLTVTVGAAPAASDDSATTPQNLDVTLHPLANDSAGDDGAGINGTLVPAALAFTSASATDGGRKLVVAGEGTWTIDPATGDATFDPEQGFTGPATPVTYEVANSFGTTTQAELRVTVTPVTPLAADDAGTTAYRTPVTLDALANDTAGAASAPLDASSVVFTSPGATDAGKTLVVPGQGTYSVAADGRITFTPAIGFTGTASAVAYEVADTNGTTTAATVTLTVTAPPAPSVADDTDHTPYRSAVTTAVLANDTAGGLAALQVSSVRFTDPASVNGGTTLVVAGEGTYQVNGTGRITFTPDAGFTGVATAVTYEVSDELGRTGAAQLVVTVGAPPAAADDATSTPQNVPVTLDPLGNDTAGDDGSGTLAALQPATVVLTSASATDAGHTLVVAGEGTWIIEVVSGEATFTPLPAFTGTTTPVGYAVADTFGNDASADLVVTVTPITPVAVDDDGHTPYRTPVTTDVLGNDSAGAASAPLDATSVVFVSPGATDGGRTLVVAGEGTWTGDPGTGAITFTPEAGFHGTATGVDYRVGDANGTTATATLTVTVGNPPSASDDAATTPYETVVTLHPLGNDTAGDDGAGSPGTLDPASMVFTSPDATGGDHTLVVAGQGTWTIVPATGAVSFDPEPGFSGSTASVAYRVTDSHGHDASALLTVTVGEPPVASDDATTTPQGVPVTLDPLANDAAGDDGTGAAGSLDAASVVFTSAAATDAGRTLVVAGEGVWTIDPVTGAATFAPEPGFAGTATPVRYEVTDSFGSSTRARLVVTVTPIIPVAADDANHTPYDTAVTTTVLGNDSAGAATAPLDAGSVVFSSPDATHGGRTLVVPGEGTYTIDPGTGAITFVPENGFAGPATPVQYRVQDANGTPVDAELAVTVGNPPAASDDSVTTPQNVTVTLCPPCNDAPGDDGAGAAGTLDAAGLVFTSPDATDGGTALAVPGEGTWTVNADGTVAFDPETAFTGVATPVTYDVTDSFGNTAHAEITVTVDPVVPETADDSATGTYDHPVTVDILGNDLPGDASAPLVANSVVFTSPDATDGGRTLVVPGEGTWTVNPDGSVTFSPEPGYTGTTTPVAYSVADANGEISTSTVTAVIAAGPAAGADQTRGGEPGQPVVIDVLGNDSGGGGCTLDAASLVLLDGGDPAQTVTTLLVPGEGTWTAKVDGTLTFSPELGFHGWTSWVTYRITDSCGNPTSARARAFVPAAPTAVDAVDDSLAYTGVELGAPLALAVILLVSGMFLLLWRRRAGRGEQ